MRIGLYGGSFNPVHNGHLGVARAALRDLELDRLIILPAALNPFKTDVPTATHEQFDRLLLVRAAFAGWEKVTVDDRELRRGGVSYAIDTVREIAAENPGAELFFIVGADSVAGLPRWKDADELWHLCTPKSFPRTRESSTEIRARLAKGEPVDDLVPPCVSTLLHNSLSFFSRSEALLGEDAVAHLVSARVLVVGVGGVGSWCAEALVRTGVGNITLVDDDVISPSNVNRQCPATSKTIGQPKVEVLATRLREINPAARIIAVCRRYPQTTSAALRAYDLVIDAIDSVDAKAQLLLDAAAAKVPVLSSMGAALRTDPTKVRVMRFDKIAGDGLAKALRNRFRKLSRWPEKFLAVCSDEPALDSPVRGSIMPVTATFGMCLASEGLKILSKPIERQVVLSLGSNVEPREDTIRKAIDCLAAFPETRLVATSDVIETDPVAVPDEFRAMKFLNAILLLKTRLLPHDFSRRMHEVEDQLGRVRTVRNGPRTIDIDLVDFGGLSLNTPELTLPHPRAHEREFVLQPWKDTVRQLMKARRATVPAEIRAAKSHELCQKLESLIGDAKIICCYEALKTELDLSEFIASCQKHGLTVVFPEKQQPRLYAVPRTGEVDLWICPGLAFSPGGERLGFGGGWYDRFLAAAKPTARSYGVAYEFQLCAALPQGPWDRPLTGIVTV